VLQRIDDRRVDPHRAVELGSRHLEVRLVRLAEVIEAPEVRDPDARQARVAAEVAAQSGEGEQQLERAAAVVEDGVRVVAAAHHRMAEPEGGHGELDWHRRDVRGRGSDLEGLAAVVEDVVDHARRRDARQVVRPDHPLVVLGHDLSCGGEAPRRRHGGRQGVDHAVVEADHRAVRLSHGEVSSLRGSGMIALRFFAAVLPAPLGRSKPTFVGPVVLPTFRWMPSAS
jgi:hypothetical protein